MNQPEQILCIILNHLLLIIRELLRRLHVQNHIESVIEVGDQILQTRQIETVLREFDFHFAEQLVA